MAKEGRSSQGFDITVVKIAERSRVFAGSLESAVCSSTTTGADLMEA